MRKPESWHDRIYIAVVCVYIYIHTQTMEHLLFLARFPTHSDAPGRYCDMLLHSREAA